MMMGAAMPKQVALIQRVSDAPITGVEGKRVGVVGYCHDHEKASVPWVTLLIHSALR